MGETVINPVARMKARRTGIRGVVHYSPDSAALHPCCMGMDDFYLPRDFDRTTIAGFSCASTKQKMPMQKDCAIRWHSRPNLLRHGATLSANSLHKNTDNYYISNQQGKNNCGTKDAIQRSYFVRTKHMAGSRQFHQS
ncbi:MAG: hypothetical protein IT488_02125 [Gammaproteobacteria bacterium]|nr:hypothetical protein [Gammaproteobacteria bacterium]